MTKCKGKKKTGEKAKGENMELLDKHRIKSIIITRLTGNLKSQMHETPKPKPLSASPGENRWVLWESDYLDSSNLPGADRSFFHSARDQTLYLGMRKRSERLVKTQVELSHTCFGTDFDPFALFSSGWNGRST